MMIVILSREQQRMVLQCEFCEGEYEYPFAASATWPDAEMGAVETNPDAQTVLHSHLMGDANLKEYGFEQCLAISRWQTTEWQLIESETGKILKSGRLFVTPTKMFSFE